MLHTKNKWKRSYGYTLAWHHLQSTFTCPLPPRQNGNMNAKTMEQIGYLLCESRVISPIALHWKPQGKCLQKSGSGWPWTDRIEEPLLPPTCWKRCYRQWKWEWERAMHGWAREDCSSLVLFIAYNGLGIFFFFRKQGREGERSKYVTILFSFHMLRCYYAVDFFCFALFEIDAFSFEICFYSMKSSLSASSKTYQGWTMACNLSGQARSNQYDRQYLDLGRCLPLPGGATIRCHFWKRVVFRQSLGFNP